MRAARNPKRLLSEAIESLRVSIPDRLQELKQTGHEIALVHGVNDHVVPYEELDGNISAEMVTGVYAVRGDHSDMSLYPDSYGVVATSAIEALEQKSLGEEDQGTDN